MKIYTTQLSTNKIAKIYFGNTCVTNLPPQQSQPNNKEVKKAKNNDKLFLALGTLALIVIGGISYKKIHSAKMLKKSNSNNSNAITQADSFLQNYIENFSKKLPQSDFFRFNDELKKLNFPKYDIIDFLKNDDAKSFVKYILAAKKSGLNKYLELPRTLMLGNLDSKAKDVSKIFATALDSNFASTKYTKGHMNQFIESLNEFSSTALKTYDQDQTHTFLHFDNASEFLGDLKLKENEQYKIRFDKIIAKNQENKIVYIVDNNATAQLTTDSILKLDFDARINTADLTKDIEEVEFQLGHKLLSKVEKANKELFEHIQPDQQSVFLIKSLLMDNIPQKVFIANSTDKSAVDKAITLIISKTNNTYEKIDCREISDLSSYLAKSGEKAEELYKRTGKRTFLYFDNLEQSQQINDFIGTASEKYHIIPILNAQNNEILSKLNLTENQILKMNFWDKGQKAMLDSLELMKEKMKKNDFSHVNNLDYFINMFINPIAAERAGKNGSTAQIDNGILLHGSDNLTRITADAIKNTVDANYVKVTFNKDKPTDIIDRIIDVSEKAEEIFQQTRKRTILEAEGLDQMLTNKNSTQAMDNISEFKSIAEDLSERYHTTLIMRTDKPLEQFEAASIASNRLGLHIKVK